MRLLCDHDTYIPHLYLVTLRAFKVNLGTKQPDLSTLQAARSVLLGKPSIAAFCSAPFHAVPELAAIALLVSRQILALRRALCPALENPQIAGLA